MGPRKIVQEIVCAHAACNVVDDDVPLGANGLGLDSIAIAEVLLECEMRFGFPFNDLLEDRAPLTVARLVSHLQTYATR